MDLFLCIVIFFLISIGLIVFAKWAEKNFSGYDTMFCRDVRASLGMFAYKSDIEEKRKRLNRQDSKF